MQTIVFIETNKSGSSREAIRAAERLGYFTVLLTNRQNFILERTEFPDVHQMVLVDIYNYGELINNISKLEKQGKKIRGILSFIDPFVYIAAALSEEFCRNAVSSYPILKMEDKVLTREAIKDLPESPYYAIYRPSDSLEDFIELHVNHFPLIVKSPVSAGSKDVLLVNDEVALKKAIVKLLKSSDQLLIEEYLIGPQYLFEVLVHNGNVHIVAVIEQEITFFKRFIVTGYALLPTSEPISSNSNILQSVTRIIKAFGMENGACHLEMRLVNGVWKLIEINPRISGGAMNRIIEVGFGINLVEETIRLMLGKTPDLGRKHSKYVYTRYLTVDMKGKLVKVTGKERSSNIPGVDEVFIKPKQGKILRPPLSMGDRCGYVIASSEKDIDEAKRIANKAASEICFHLDPI